METATRIGETIFCKKDFNACAAVRRRDGRGQLLRFLGMPAVRAGHNQPLLFKCFIDVLDEVDRTEVTRDRSRRGWHVDDVEALVNEHLAQALQIGITVPSDSSSALSGLVRSLI